MRAIKISILLLAVLVSGCASLPDNVGRTPSLAIEDTDETFLAKNLINELNSHPGQSGFHLLDDGVNAFVARTALARIAERSLDIQYYLYHTDLTGSLLTKELLMAADRGVRVRVLLDDMGLGGRDDNLLAADQHPNIEIRIFNPFIRNSWRPGQFITRKGKVSRRMHNKSFTADNQATIIGGRNIGDEYFDADPLLAFGDLDVMAIGPVVKDISTAFDKYWNSESAYPITLLTGKSTNPLLASERLSALQTFKEQENTVFNHYIKAMQASSLSQKLKNDTVGFDWGEAVAIYDSPNKLLAEVGDESLQLAPQLKPFIDATTKELSILSAYFVPGKEGIEFYKVLRDRGVRVRIVTNSLASTDVSIVHSGYKKYREKLLRMGVELYEINRPADDLTTKNHKKNSTGSSGASLHAKAFLFDRKILFIGSLNLDPRSFEQNTEIGIVFSAPTLAEEMALAFDAMDKERVFSLKLEHIDGDEQIVWEGLENGKPVRYYTDPHTSVWKRFWVDLLGLLPIEHEL